MRLNFYTTIRPAPPELHKARPSFPGWYGASLVAVQEQRCYTQQKPGQSILLA